MAHSEKADGLQKPDKETEGYIFNHMMLRIKDPKKILRVLFKSNGYEISKKN